MSALFSFDEDAARVLIAVLDDSDLEALTGVSTASRRSCFRSIRDEKPWIHVLLPNDRDRARKLLLGFHPARLTRFQWIQIAATWHVNLVVACRLTNFFQSVRVVPRNVEDTAELEDTCVKLDETCVKLPLLRRITKLNMADTAITDVSPLALMT